MLYIYRNKNNLLSFFAELLTVVIFLIFICMYIFEINISRDLLSLLVLCNSLSMFILLITNPTVYHSGTLMMFFTYNLIVNNGFVIAMFINNEYITFQSVTSMAFLRNEYYHEAIIIANIVLSAFSLSLIYSKKRDMIFKSIKIENNDEGNTAANIIGVGLITVCTLYVVYVVFANGLWFSGYLTTLRLLENTAFPHFVVIASLSIAFLISSGTRKYVHIGILIFGVYSLFQFAMGNRGEVFYAAVICFALYSLRFKSIGYRQIIIAGLAVIVLIPLVRISRELKIDGYMLNPLNSLLDVLAEEGIEISPFTYIVQYVHQNGGYVWGMTYVNNFADFILRRIGMSSPFAIEKYVIKEIMPYDGMAFSMIAETYYNFTVVGSVIVYMIVGQYIRNFDRKFYSNNLNEMQRIVGSMLMVELINLTRNDASTLPFYLAYTFIILIFYKLTKVVIKKR